MNNTLLIVGYVAVMLIAFTPTMLSQRKRKKQQQELIEGLAAGDLVTTIGGLQGTLVKINDDLGTVEIQVDKGVKLTYLKSSIASSKKK